MAALDFDLACTMRLITHDLEAEKRQNEAAAVSAAMDTLGHLVGKK